MTPTLIYCYDAYCGWCYGFSPVMKKIETRYRDQIRFEVLSGGMILSENPKPIGVMAPFIQQAYQTVEAHTGIRFGKDFLWHIFNPDQSDWFPDSEKAAIALCIAKEYQPGLQISFAADLQYALNYEGRDLCDDEAYRHLLAAYDIPAEAFYQKLHDAAYRDLALHEFSLCKQLRVTGFPAVFIQTAALKFYQVASGYTDYPTLSQRIDQVLRDTITEKHTE